MVEDVPEVAELDLNPVFVRDDGQGVVAVDVRMKLVQVRRAHRPSPEMPPGWVAEGEHRAVHASGCCRL